MTRLARADLLFVLVTVVCVSPLSSQGAVRSPVTGKFYSLTPLGSWDQVQAYARATGWHLATIPNLQQQQWLEATFGLSESLWIGLNDRDQEGVFSWSSGFPFSWSNWCQGEPNSGGTSGVDEDGVFMSASSTQCPGSWNDAPTTQILRGIMERAPAEYGGNLLIVDPAIPGGFASLQAATAAATPYDTVRVATSINLSGAIIDKSLYIVNDGTLRDISISHPSFGTIQGAQFGTPMSPTDVTLRGFVLHDLVHPDFPDAVIRFYSTSLMIEDCDFTWDTSFTNNISSPSYPVMDVFGGTVSLLRTSILAIGRDPDYGCFDMHGPSDGWVALSVRADSLSLRHVGLTGGDGQGIRLRCCWGTPPNCTGYTNAYETGAGGAALSALVVNTPVFDSVSLTDGRGGLSEDPARWRQGPDAVSTLNGRSIVFGGHQTFRQSCLGEVGYPSITAYGFPRLGEVFRFYVSNLKPNTPGLFFIAFDAGQWAGQQLPLDLSSLGALGCFLNINIDPMSGASCFVLLSNNWGSAHQDLAIPADRGFYGMSFYEQYISLEAPAWRPLPVTFSNAGASVIGN